jgi:Protein of unknown function (DUF3574)
LKILSTLITTLICTGLVGSETHRKGEKKASPIRKKVKRVRRQLQDFESPDEFPEPAANPRWIRSDLFFGLSIIQVNGTNIDIPISDFKGFLDSTVTPRFPDGLTWIQSNGQCLNNFGELVKENRIQLILFTPVAYGDSHFDGLVEVAWAYTEQFDLESVLVSSESDRILCFVAQDTNDASQCSETLIRRRLMSGSINW